MKILIPLFTLVVLAGCGSKFENTPHPFVELDESASINSEDQMREHGCYFTGKSSAPHLECDAVQSSAQAYDQRVALIEYACNYKRLEISVSDRNATTRLSLGIKGVAADLAVFSDLNHEFAFPKFANEPEILRDFYMTLLAINRTDEALVVFNRSQQDATIQGPEKNLSGYTMSELRYLEQQLSTDTTLDRINRELMYKAITKLRALESSP